MNIISARVNWHSEYDNSPTFEILVDKFPDRKDFRYKEKNGIYYAELEGLVSFFYYRSPGNGYGGQKFSIVMEDGTKKDLIGPWSSRSGAVNSIGFGPCLDVFLTNNPESYKRGYTFSASAVSFELAKKAAHLAGCELICELNKNGRGALSAEQSSSIYSREDDFSDVSVLNVLKYPVEGDVTIHPFSEKKCVCVRCNQIRINDRFVKKEQTCHTCGAEQYKKNKTYPEDWKQSNG